MIPDNIEFALKTHLSKISSEAALCLTSTDPVRLALAIERIDRWCAELYGVQEAVKQLVRELNKQKRSKAMMTDLDRQLVTAMGDCPNCAGTGLGQGKEYYAGCKNCNKTGKRPVLLGVVVERCAKGVHQYKTKEHRLALFGEDLDCACLDHCGYVLAWDIGKALEWLLKDYIVNIHGEDWDSQGVHKVHLFRFTEGKPTNPEGEGATLDEAVQQAMLAILRAQ